MLAVLAALQTLQQHLYLQSVLNAKLVDQRNALLGLTTHYSQALPQQAALHNLPMPPALPGSGHSFPQLRPQPNLQLRATPQHPEQFGQQQPHLHSRRELHGGAQGAELGGTSSGAGSRRLPQQARSKTRGEAHGDHAAGEFEQQATAAQGQRRSSRRAAAAAAAAAAVLAREEAEDDQQEASPLQVSSSVALSLVF